MSNLNQFVKPLMQILFGIGLFVIYLITKETIPKLGKYETNHYDPGTDLFIYFLNWASLIGSILLILIGTLALIKLIYKNK